MQFKTLSLFIGFTLQSAVLLAQAPVEDIGGGGMSQSGARRDMQGELYQQLQQLRQEIMELRGTVEEQGHQIRQLKQQSLDRYIDLDRRISASSAGPLPAGESEDTMLDGPEGDGSQPGAQTRTSGGTSLPAGHEQAAAAAQGARGPGLDQSAGGEGGADLGGNPSSDYSKAYGLVRERRFEEAITAFNEYVKVYPDGRYTPNAWYWLGELYLAVKPQNLPAASAAFQRLLADYPNSGKVPAAMYKLATVYYLDGQKQKAKDMLTHVIDRYSNTGNSAVQKSREFLRKNF